MIKILKFILKLIWKVICDILLTILLLICALAIIWFILNNFEAADVFRDFFASTISYIWELIKGFLTI